MLMGNGKVECMEKEIGQGIATPCFGDNLWPMVPFTSSSVPTQLQEEPRKHWGNEIHTNGHEVHPLHHGFIDDILLCRKANLHEPVKCCLEFLAIEDSLVCLV